MAGGGPITPGNGKAYPGNLTLYVTVTCIVAAMGGLIFGYDIGISGIKKKVIPHVKFLFFDLFTSDELIFYGF